ncbi:hypothetical protein [Priestia megaterium]|uniref:hypothetical protein n=1 Tax=Priestia megaterium TaxID=1404 RepID=UPI000BFCEC8F|nr:hypothetical protein [Priestia megaterium]PGQ88171.1 hypothetical protein COA18_04405 [Priestia megaterium]
MDNLIWVMRAGEELAKLKRSGHYDGAESVALIVIFSILIVYLLWFLQIIIKVLKKIYNIFSKILKKIRNIFSKKKENE